MGIDNNLQKFFFLAIAKNLTFKARSITKLRISIITTLGDAILQMSNANKKLSYFNNFRIIYQSFKKIFTFINAKKSLTTCTWGQVNNKSSKSCNLTNK